MQGDKFWRKGKQNYSVLVWMEESIILHLNWTIKHIKSIDNQIAILVKGQFT